MFKLYNNKGFTITFPNGYEVSTMIGEGNYCTARDIAGSRFDRSRGSATAEVVVFVSGTNRVIPNRILKVDAPAMSSDDRTFGWSKPEVFAAICAAVAALPPGLVGDE